MQPPADPIPIVRSAAGRRKPGCAARSVRERDQISRREDRRARQHGAGRVAVWLCHRHHRPAAVPQSRLRRRGQGEVGCRKLTTPTRNTTNDKMVRPYRVGMSCGFCHVGPKPDASARRSGKPAFADLSSTVGAQYMWVDRLFIYRRSPDNFFFQLVHTYRPGAMDTSLVSTDNINNPRTMNAIYALGARLQQALRWGRRRWRAASSTTSSSTIIYGGPLTQFYQKPDTVWTPRVLKDGSDSVGALGALNRVYLNIGLFSEEWLLHFNAVVGGKPITPIEIATAEKNSSYWQATEARTPPTALFFLQAAKPDHLKDAPGGAKYLRRTRPCWIAARRCSPRPARAAIPARHPSLPWGLIRPAAPGLAICNAGTPTGRGPRPTTTRGRCARSSRAGFPRRQLPVGRSSRAGDAAANQRLQPTRDQRAGRQYLGQLLVPVLQEPAVGRHITVHDPFTGKPWQWQMPAGGRGYTRPPSLISLWSTAPFLLNNSVGGRIRAGSVGRCTHAGVPGVDRANAVAREARARPDPRRHRPG